jgi:hypothetical protein
MRSLALAALAAILLVAPAAPQAPSPGPQWASVGASSVHVSSWMDTTAVEVVGSDRFRVRTLLILGIPMPLPAGGGKFDRSLAVVEYDCAGRTAELIEGQWLLGGSVVYTNRPSGSADPFRGRHPDLICQLARRVSQGHTAPADSSRGSD